MPSTFDSTATVSPEILTSVLQTVWGYGQFRPFQRETVETILSGQDSMTILPTGGGKSLCYQLPILARGHGAAIVISPLIALMKDQVDAAKALGIRAALLNSTLDAEDQAEVMYRLTSGELQLLYVTPERMVQKGFIKKLQDSGVITYIAIDEAHCISQWGHDFRQEYRQLGALKTLFPECSVHAFTATATPSVQQDILRSLNLHQPKVFIGSYDRPNLVYRVEEKPTTKQRFYDQLADTIGAWKDEAGIIYCISRAEVEQTSASLNERGFNTLPYHAGMPDRLRRKHQDAFMNEQVDVMVATVAFGMGIDRSNIRYVIHTGMPKSPEHYQQEAGRAGRDGLTSQCILYYSSKDAAVWNRMMENTAREYRDDPQVQAHVRHMGAKLADMVDYCRSPYCRHRFLVEYFGQTFNKFDCGACDICLGDREVVKDALTIARQILSCVWRVGQAESSVYVNRVLSGSRDKRIAEKGHDTLSTFGLLSHIPREVVRDWIDQLISQKFLSRETPASPLIITPEGSRLLKGLDQRVKLLQDKPVKVHGVVTQKPDRHKKAETGKIRMEKLAATNDWQDVDKSLFKTLKELRLQLSKEHEVPPFIIFSDATLREMAKRKPKTNDAMLRVPGVGSRKMEAYGELFLRTIKEST